MANSRNLDQWGIGVDLGASTFKVGIVSPDHRIVARAQEDTRALEGPEQAADRIAAAVQRLLSQVPEAASTKRLGICSPGPVNHVTGYIVDPPNLTGWRNVPFARMVGERLSMEVRLEHDAKAAALGEYHYGAGRGTRNMTLIIVGTGIGCAMILDGKLYRGPNDSAGEIGHITVDLDGPICTCGSNGCIETYAGGPAIMNAYNYSTRHSVASAEEVVWAAQKGDRVAQRVFERAGRALGAGIATLAMLMDIDTFVLFGSVVKAGDLLLEPARRAVPSYSHPSVASRVRILIGELGNDAGILGAAFAATETE